MATIALLTLNWDRFPVDKCPTTDLYLLLDGLYGD